MGDQLSSDLASLRIDHGEQPGRGGGTRVLVYLIIVAGVAAALYFLALPAVKEKFVKSEVSVAEISMVSPASASVEFSSTGYVMPQVVSMAVPKLPGRVSEARVNQGDQVKAGEVLMVLDTVDQDAAIAASRTQVATARANAETARANLAEIKQQAVRERELAAQGLSPKAGADDLDRRADALGAAVKAADAAVRAAQSEVAAMEINRRNYTLVSPINGRVIGKPPEVGDFVGPAMAGVADVAGNIEIADFASLAVETDVPESRLGAIKSQQPCEIVLDAFPDRRLRGEVYEIVPRVNRSKATVMIKVKFVDPATDALPDMSARVSFLSGKIDENAVKEPPKLVVPGDAVTERAGAKVVFVLDDGRLRMAPVELGKPFGEGFELVKGPSPGSKVVMKPGPELVDGQQVKERTDG